MATNSMGNLFFFLPFFFGGGSPTFVLVAPTLVVVVAPTLVVVVAPTLVVVGTGHLPMWGRAT